MNYVCGIVFFFFNDTATTEIYTLSLHDALPIFARPEVEIRRLPGSVLKLDEINRRMKGSHRSKWRCTVLSWQSYS